MSKYYVFVDNGQIMESNTSNSMVIYRYINTDKDVPLGRYSSAQCISISRNVAEYLSHMPDIERVSMLRNKSYEKVRKMKPGAPCLVSFNCKRIPGLLISTNNGRCDYEVYCIKLNNGLVVSVSDYQIDPIEDELVEYYLIMAGADKGVIIMKYKLFTLSWPDLNSINDTNVVVNGVVNLDLRLRKYLIKINKLERVNNYNNKMLDKLDSLTNGDLCLVKETNGFTKYGIVTGKEWRNDELFLKIKATLYLASNVTIIPKEHLQYFLVTVNVVNLSKGNIIVKHDKQVINYPNLAIYEGFEVSALKEVLAELSVREFKYLLKLKQSERLDHFDNKTLDKLSNLDINDSCLVKETNGTTKYGIVTGKEWKNDELYFDMIIEASKKAGIFAFQLEQIKEGLKEYFEITAPVGGREKGSIVMKYGDYIMTYPDYVMLTGGKITDEQMIKVAMGKRTISNETKTAPDSSTRLDNLVKMLFNVKDCFSLYINNLDPCDIIQDVDLLIKIVTNNKEPIKLKDCEQLIKQLIEIERHDVVRLILKNIELMSEGDLLHLINLATSPVLTEESKLEYLYLIFGVVEESWQNKEILIGGETLLTKLINFNASYVARGDGTSNKTHVPFINISQTTIIDLANKYNHLFDVNKSNQSGETPLLLACKTVSLKLVESLLSNPQIKLTKELLNKCIEIIDNFDETQPEIAKLELELLKISKLLYKNMGQISNNKQLECTICMENSRNVAFQCGHTCCSSCGNKIDHCPFCKLEITSKIPIFIE